MSPSAPASLVLGDGTVDLTTRALLVVPETSMAGVPAAPGADVVEVEAGDDDPDRVAARVRALIRSTGLPVVVRTGRTEVVAAAARAGAVAVDLRGPGAEAGLVGVVDRVGVVAVVPFVLPETVGLSPHRVVVDPGDRPPPAGLPPGTVVMWSSPLSEGTGPRALVGVALAVTRGRRWIRVPTAAGFGAVRDTLAAVERVRTGGTGVAG